MSKAIAPKRRSLREIEGISPLYILPADSLIDEVLIPGFTCAENVDSMMGYFTSSALADLAPGLATFVNQASGKLRLIISPILRNDDVAAIKAGLEDVSALEIAGRALSNMVITSDAIERHTLKCLAWLIWQQRIEIRVALMKRGRFHPKVWLFRNESDIVAVHGSSNWTESGIGLNVEQIAVSKSWREGDSSFTTNKLMGSFESYWSGREADCVVTDIPKAIEKNLIQTYRTERMPNESDLRELYRKAIMQVSITSDTPDSLEKQRPVFEIPEGLQFETGEFAHQGEAVSAWLNADCRGILEMATGSGKTITSLICAHRLFESARPLLIVVAAPYVPLLYQWDSEIREFGIAPVNMDNANGRYGRARTLAVLKRQLRRNSSEARAVVVSHDLLCNAEFQDELAGWNCTKLLIADEVHNLGRSAFITNPPEFFDFRLGLSATPERQYDEVGTEELFAFFGPSVFSFSLEQAIGKCLVEYDYFIHRVELTAEELERWHLLTAEIRKNSWREDEGVPNTYLSKLYRDRRVVLENADNKVQILADLIDRDANDYLKHTLIYTSDKGPEQIDKVNGLLRDRRFLYHQLTSEETADRNKTQQILRSFQQGEISVLTAKRVLDEGVNIPQIRRAFILASTTVERQWVQRRGRLLRQCDEIGKTHSEIHDFVVMPPEGYSSAERSMARSELRRVQEFAGLARNAGAPGGPLDVASVLVENAYY